jgi:hypothetical protein
MSEKTLVTVEQLELMRLLEGADSVELKLTVPASSGRNAVHALGIDPLEAQIRQVFFFDTPSLELNQAGVVVRARRVQERGDDSVVKLRPVVPRTSRPSCAGRRTSSSRWTRCQYFANQMPGATG